MCVSRLGKKVDLGGGGCFGRCNTAEIWQPISPVHFSLCLINDGRGVYFWDRSLIFGLLDVFIERGVCGLHPSEGKHFFPIGMGELRKTKAYVHH